MNSKKNSEEIAKQYAVLVNKIRVEKKIITQKEFMGELNSSGLPYPLGIYGMLCKAHIKRVSRDGEVYVEFVTPGESVHFSVFQDYIKSIRKSRNDYAKKERLKSKESKTEKVITISVEDAINLLLDHGYRILKPITNYEEISRK